MKNLSASVHQRLLNAARSAKADFNSVAIQYANERFLARLAKSVHRDAFVLKGATMLLVWLGESVRRTRDVDLLGFGSPDASSVCHRFREVLATEVEDDGLEFDLSSVHGEPIREEQPYEGVRVVFLARLGKMPIALQVDVGFGDAVFPLPETVEVPPILDLPPPVLRGYRMETSMAEKFSAMIERGIANSRMKDYYDIWLLSSRFELNATLIESVERTLERRGLPLPGVAPVGVSVEFACDSSKLSQWSAFVRKTGAHGAPTLAEAVDRAHTLFEPSWSSRPVSRWPSGGPWS